MSPDNVTGWSVPDHGFEPPPPPTPRRRGPRLPRRLLVAVVLGAVVVVGVLLLGGGGGDGEDGEVTERIVEALEASSIPEEDAECLAEHLVDELGTKDLGRIDDFSKPPPEGLSEGFDAAFTVAETEAIEACKVSVGGTSDP